MQPAINILFKIRLEESFISANGIMRITEIITCKIKRESKLLNQLLKKPSVDLFERHKIANGERMVNTFIRIYLREKFIVNVNDETIKTP